MFDIYEKYTPQEIRDAIGWKNGADTTDLSTAIMILCGMIQELQAKVEKLEKEKKKARGEQS